MLKRLIIGAAMVAMTTIPAKAQGQDLIVRMVEVPGAHFDIVFVMSRPTAAETTDPLTVYPTGDALGFAMAGEFEKSLNGAGVIGLPIRAVRLVINGDKPSQAINVYVMPRLGPPMQ